jgi:hypothetical protein
MHVLGGHAVAWQVDHLAGIDVPPCVQCCRGVEQRHQLADAAGTSQHRELVRYGPGLGVMQDIGPESQVMSGPPLQDGMVPGPRGWVLGAGDGPPPRVRVREALAALIISHSPTLPSDLTKPEVNDIAPNKKPTHGG